MDDDDFMYDDQDDYMDDDEYGDEEEDDPEVLIENKYFEAKDMMEQDVDEAISMFKEVIDMEEKKGKWGFKSLKRTCKLEHTRGNHAPILPTFKEMLTYTASAVTLNESEKALNSLLEFLASSPHIKELYELTLDAFRAKNEKACLRLELKLSKVLLKQRDFDELQKLLDRLHDRCRLEDGSDDPSKGSQLLEIYAQEIQLHTYTGDRARLKTLYHEALAVKAAVPSPRIVGIIRECGAKMWMREKKWMKAYEDFFEAFKNYDEAGSSRRINCLRYLVIASMLMGSNINPFEETRAKSYKANDDVKDLITLLDAYEHQDIIQFEKVLKKNRKSIVEDEFIKDYIQDLMRNIRTQVLLKRLKPYTRIRLDYVSKELNIDGADVEQLLVSLILDSKIEGSLDQVNGVLELKTAQTGHFWKYRAIDSWAASLNTAQRAVTGRLSG